VVNAWLTPTETANGQITIALTVPSGEEWETIVRGALAALGEVENFELYGAVTPEEAAQTFRDALVITFQWEPCP